MAKVHDLKTSQVKPQRDISPHFLIWKITPGVFHKIQMILANSQRPIEMV